MKKMKTSVRASIKASIKASKANLNASTTDRGQSDDVSALYGQQELNRELKDLKRRGEQRELKAHENRTGRFLERDLPVQVWATLKAPETRPARRRKARPLSRIDCVPGVITAASANELWDDALKRFINELQRQVGFSVGYIRADEARPYRHVHIAIVSHRPVRLTDVKNAWLAVIGPDHGKRVWVERYSPRGGGLAYQMKSDGQHGCGWQLSQNIELFRRSGDGKIRRPSTARERRNARRVLEQRVATTTPKKPVSPTTRHVEPQSDHGSHPAAGVVRLTGRQEATIRLVDPRCGGRLVASRPAQHAA